MKLYDSNSYKLLKTFSLPNNQPVYGIQFCGSPLVPDLYNHIIVGGKNNSFITLWKLSDDLDAKMIQTVTLEAAPNEIELLNHIELDSASFFLLVASTQSNVLITLYLAKQGEDYKFVNIVEFDTVQPILSFMSMTKVINVEKKQIVMGLFCIQTESMQLLNISGDQCMQKQPKEEEEIPPEVQKSQELLQQLMEKQMQQQEQMKPKEQEVPPEELKQAEETTVGKDEETEKVKGKNKKKNGFNKRHKTKGSPQVYKKIQPVEELQQQQYTVKQKPIKKEILPTEENEEITDFQKLENNIISKLEKMIESNSEKMINRLYTRLENERKERLKDEHARFERLLDTISKTLAKDIPEDLEEILEKSIQEQIIPQMTKLISQVIEQQLVKPTKDALQQALDKVN